MSLANPPNKVSTMFNNDYFDNSNTSVTCNVIVQAPTIVIGGVETISPTSSNTLGLATASITGNSPNYSLNLGIPGGVKGDTGAPGATPTFNPTGDASSLDAGSSPTVAVNPDGPNNYKLSLGIPKSEIDTTKDYTFSGNNTFTKTNTFSGTTTFSGSNNTFTNNLTVSNPTGDGVYLYANRITCYNGSSNIDMRVTPAQNGTYI